MEWIGWNHHNPVEIRFGRGCRSALFSLIKEEACLIVTSSRGRIQLENDPVLGEHLPGIDSIWMDAVQTNPDRQMLQGQIEELRKTSIKRVIAFGGGSVIDSAKTLALALGRAGTGRTLAELMKLSPKMPMGDSLPLHTVPTTAGTGSEVTPFATVWDHASRRKLSLAGVAIYPQTAWIDPALTDSMPPHVTLSTGLDAICQAAESIWNQGMTPVTEALAQRSLALGFDALPKLMENPEDQASRDDMAEASLLAGLAISQTRTALCHAISYPLTAHFGIPHGIACAFTMPAVLRHNLVADDGRFKRLAACLGTAKGGDAYDLTNEFNTFNRRLDVSGQVRRMIGAPEALYRLRDEMLTPGRAENGIAPLGRGTVQAILEQSWHG